MDPEVIVVGAGPAGSSAAYHLARSGHHVLLLEKTSFPREKACGDALSRPAVQLLTEMGIIEGFSHCQRVTGVSVFLAGKGRRDLEYEVNQKNSVLGMIIPRADLDHALCRKATAAGAELWEETHVTNLIWTDQVVTGVEALRHGRKLQLKSAVIVAANGASSVLARRAKTFNAPQQEFGCAIRSYYDNINHLSGMLEIYIPLTDPGDKYVLPAYGWVFPTGESSANIGVGLFEPQRLSTVSKIFRRFIETLQREDARFHRAESISAPRAAPLRFRFEPHRCVQPGLLLVGDSAGLTNPFTGEGIRYALESGKLAAEVVHNSLSSISLAGFEVADYATILQRRYSGPFELGSANIRRAETMWDLLEATFQDDRSFFETCRGRLHSANSA